MEKIKASIIIRAYNAEATVARAVRSALEQEFPHDEYEIVIVNDGSTDGTRQVIDSFAHDSRIHVIHQENQGAILAANNGLQAARGEYVTLLDSDDEFSSRLLAEMVSVMDEDPELAFCYCDYAEEFEGVRKEVVVDDVFKMVAGGTLWRRTLLEREEWFRNVCIFAEYDLLLRTWGRWRFAHAPQSLYVYHRLSKSLTGDPARVEANIAKLRELHPERGEEIKRIRSYILPV